MGDFRVIGGKSCDVVRRCTTSQSSGGQSHDILAVFGHVLKLAAILVHLGYLKMIVRCRAMSRRRRDLQDICAIDVR